MIPHCQSHTKRIRGCDACRLALNAYEKHRKRQLRRPDGYWEPLVPADEARARINELRAQGMSLPSIAAAARIPEMTINAILYGSPGAGIAPTKRIRKETAASILAAHAGRVPDEMRVPRATTDQYVNDLVAHGYTKRQIAVMVGIKNFPKGQTMWAWVARRIEALWREEMRRAA